MEQPTAYQSSPNYDDYANYGAEKPARENPPPEKSPPWSYPPQEKSPPWSYPPQEKNPPRPYPPYRDFYPPKRTSRPKEKLGFTMRNLISQSCLFRVALALASLGGWIAAIFTQIGLHDSIGFHQFSSIRSALMAFMVWSYFIAIILFFLDWSNLFNVGIFVKVPINRIIIGLDCITFCGVGITSIIGFIRGRQIPTTFIGPYPASNSYRIVAFYITSIFGFAVCALLIIEISFLIIKMIFKGRTFSFLE